MKKTRTFFVLFVFFLFLSPPGNAGKKITIHDILSIKRVSSPKISPDNSKVIFNSQGHIWLIDLEGDEVNQFTNGRGGGSNGQWSSDGEKVAFVANRDGKRQIWIIPIDGGEAIKLVDLKDSVGRYALSKDWKKLAYIKRDERPDKEKREERRRKGNNAFIVDEKPRMRTHIFVYDIETQKLKQITSGD